MKKFYTLLVAAVVAISASAVTLNLESAKQVRALQPVKKEALANATLAPKGVKSKKNVESSLAGKTVLRAQKKAADAAGIEGTWLFDLGDYYFQTSVGPFSYEFEASLDGNDVWFEDPTGYELPFVGTFDAAAGTITFQRKSLGTLNGYYVFQEPFVYNYTTNDLDVQPIVAEYYDYNGGILLFESDNGISWPAYSSPLASTPAGYFGIYDLEGATKTTSSGGGEVEPIDEEQAGQWESVGMAKFVDAWVLPSYSMGGVQINPNDFIYEVELQQNVENKDLFRLWKPYANNELTLEGLNTSTFAGQIQFNISDPDHVEVVACGLPAGFKNSNGEFYMTNELGWYINYLGGGETAKQTVIDVLYGGEPADTYKDGVVTINEPMFDFSPAQDEGYSWNNNPYQALIIFPEGFGKGEGIEGKGEMTSQLDMNQGMLEEPELLDPETIEVAATYADGKLTITPFGDGNNAITFDVDLTTGALTAKDQIANEDDGLTYYFSDVATQTTTVNGKVVNYGDDKSFVTVDAWGEGNEFEGFGFFFNTAYYNTEITLDFAIPGLEATATQPTITIGDVVVNAYPATEESIGAMVNFQVPVTTEGLAEDAVVTVYYQGPLDDDFKAVEENHGQYSFDLGGLQFDTEYTVKIYAASGNVKSDVKEVDFKTFTPATASAKVLYVMVDEDEITSTSANVYVSYGFENAPADSKAYVIAVDGIDRNEYRVEANPFGFGFEAAITMDGLKPATEYPFYVVAELQDAEGNIITRSDLVYGQFTTAEDLSPVASIDYVVVDEVTSTTANVYAVYSFENAPADSKAYVIVTESVNRKDFKVEVSNDAKYLEATVALAGLAPATAYDIMVVGQLEDAEGNIILRSNVMYDSFTTEEEVAEETFTQLLHNPNKAKKNILEGEDLGAPEGWSMQCMNLEKNLESSDRMTVNGEQYISIKTSNGAQNTVTLPSE
ncbi:MAG: hypothetical protein J1E63_10620, partial [Muribaculaceae bacterium]|nr:hypothetical protein [Muribaculaceae bacterium]